MCLFILELSSWGNFANYDGAVPLIRICEVFLELFRLISKPVL